MELVERILVPLVGGVNPGADLKVSGMKVRFAVRYSESLDGTQCVLLIQRFDRKLTAKPVSPHPDRCYCELICGVSSGLLRGYREGPAETGLELHKLRAVQRFGLALRSTSNSSGRDRADKPHSRLNQHDCSWVSRVVGILNAVPNTSAILVVAHYGGELPRQCSPETATPLLCTG